MIKLYKDLKNSKNNKNNYKQVINMLELKNNLKDKMNNLSKLINCSLVFIFLALYLIVLLTSKISFATENNTNSANNANGDTNIDVSNNDINNIELNIISPEYSSLGMKIVSEDNVLNSAKSENKVTPKILNKDSITFIQNVVEQINENYIDDIKNKDLVEGAISGMLTSLDPHSMYLNSKNYNNMTNSTKGEFGGIGVEMSIEGNVIRVVSPYEEGPAFKVGIKSNDIIIKIDDQDVSEMENIILATEKLRGAAGTLVKLTVLRDNSRTLNFNIVREIIKIIPVSSKLISNKTIAYIKLKYFNNKTLQSTKNEFLNLYKNNPNIEGIIVDLRWNPGGLLEQATGVADLFMDSGDIVSIMGRVPDNNVLYKAEKNDISNGLPIVVIVNSGTASAAEIVAGAWQDNKRALILGTKSFGKGSIQRLIPLSDGSAMKLTTALYYTPNGNSIQAKGILPDILVNEAIVKEVHNQDNIFESSLKLHIPNSISENKDAINENNDNNSINNNINDNVKSDDDINKKEKNDERNNEKNNNKLKGQIKNKKYNDISQEEYRIMINDEKQDFQLLRAIDVVKAMALYNKK